MPVIHLENGETVVLDDGELPLTLPEMSDYKAHGGNAPLEYPAGSVGVQVGLGAELFQRLQVSLSYTWGLTYEIRTIKLDNFSARSQHWGVNVAWFF